MKKLFLIFALFLSIVNLFSQKTNSLYLPDKSPKMPEWMNLFYDGVTNAHQIEDAFNLYYKLHTFEKTTYTQYYKRWMIENERYVQEDGTIVKPENNPSSKYNATSNSRSPSSTWSLMGPIETFQPTWSDAVQPSIPWQVNLYAFDAAPSNPNILYACPETGGIFKTIDKGLNWISVSDTIRLGTITAIAIDPSNPDIVYAAGTNSLYKTTDGGGTWNAVYTASGLACNDIAIFPSNPNILFIARGSGLYKSIDAGINFTLVTGMTGAVYDIETSPLRDSSIFILRKPSADTLVRFYRSYDAGMTFNLINNGWIVGASTAGRMTVTPADTNYIYTVLLMGSSIAAPIILRSTDGGSNWVHTCTGIQNSLQGDNSSPFGMSNGQGYYDLSIMASTINPNEIIVGSTTAYKSTDTANTFTRIGGYGGNFTLHPDVQEMKMIGNDAWIATDGGLNYSTDFYSNTANWSARNKGIYGSDYWGYGQGWNEDLATGGRYHNGNTAMYDGYPAGEALRLGGGEAGTGYGMVGRDMYVAHSDIGASVLPRTFSGNKSDFAFNLYPNEDGYGWDASEVEFYPECYNYIYIGKDSSLWKSIDGGVSFSEIYNFHQRVKKFEVCRSNPLAMYLSTSVKLYKTTDGGVSWTILGLPGGTSFTNLSLSVSYLDENILWITSKYNSSNFKVFKTTDGGATWINLTTPTINSYSFQIINHQAGTDGGVYITSADYAKVFYRNNSMSDWVDFSANLPAEYKPLTTKPFYMKNKLRTAGNRGIWEVDFYEDGNPVVQPTVDKLESNCMRDTFYFDDFSAVNHSLVAWQWSFPGASYVSATNIRNPRVMYSTLGAHNATLTVTQNSVVQTKSVTVNVLGNACEADTIPGSAVSISSDGNYASVPRLDLNSNTITISAWIKPDATQHDWAGVVFTRGGTSCNGISIMANYEVKYHWDANFYNYSSGLFVTPNEWNHVALVMTPTSATIYVNGIASTDNNTYDPEAFDAATYIGNDNNNPNRTFKGLIDEVCFWNRSLSIDEIRALRHLTKTPTFDPSIVAYYQFNEISGPVLDRAGVRHATLTSGAVRAVSTGPFAGGISAKLTINSGGLNNFAGTDVKIAFPTAGGSIYPDGDVWVSKLNYHPDQNANPYPMVNKYWVINNYGNNNTFSTIDSIVFNGLPTLPLTNPAGYYVYTRNANDDGTTWGSIHDTADVYTLNGNNSSLKFSTNNNITTFGQFSLNAFTMPGAGIHDPNNATNFEVTAYPNPSENELFLELTSPKQSKNSSVTIYNSIGKQVITSKQNIKPGKNIILLNLGSLSNGIYMIAVEIDGSRKTQRVLIER